ncbi:MAG: hypothetical protein E7062_04720 [Spirochaetaceae bacterium]|nr:hypothetical protein [Spirochaetaceae bacterium]
MKKEIMLIFVFLILLLSPLFSLDVLVVSTIGKAEVQREGFWFPLKQGERLHKGQMISTGFKSEVVLKIGESNVTVRALSRLSIENLQEQDGNHNSQVFLDVGGIKADVKAAKDRRVGFTVRSPVATASVRGTSGIIKSNGSLQGLTGTWQIKKQQNRPFVHSQNDISPEASFDFEKDSVWDSKNTFFVKQNQEISFNKTGSVVTNKVHAEKKTSMHHNAVLSGSQIEYGSNHSQFGGNTEKTGSVTIIVTPQ